MKTIFRTLALSAAFLSMFTACQREELEQNQEPETPKTHTVTFVAGEPETKTSATIDNGKVLYAWKETDASTDGKQEKFTVYENDTPAINVTSILVDDLMYIEAEFNGESLDNPKYKALFNAGVKKNQTVDSSEDYDQDSDVLISREETAVGESGFLEFAFKREVAFGKVTLKGLEKGNSLTKFTVESLDGTILAADYDFKTSKFDTEGESASTSIEVVSLIDIIGGEATIMFVSLPIDGAMLKVTAETSNDSGVEAIYTKEFTKPLTLTRGDIRGFGVSNMTMIEDPHANDNGWFLVKDARFLSAGDVIRIGCATAGKVAGSLSSQILSSETATYNGDQMESAASAENFTLGGAAGAWTLSTLTGKLGATNLKKLSENEGAAGYVGTWTITIDGEGAATIAPTANNFGRILCNNTSGQERFTTYTSDVQSNMILPGIYKKYGTSAESKKDQTISFDPTSCEATIGGENTYPTLTAQSTGAKTWVSSNTEVATINASTGEITLVAAGATTITVTVAGDETYNEGTGSYELTVVEAGDVWQLVTNANDLAVGDVIVIVASNSAVALSTTQNDNNRGQQEVTKSNNTVTIDDKVQQLTLGEGTKTGTFSLSTGSGYLYAASSDNNHLKEQTTLDDNGSWTITIAEDKATIKAQGTNTRNWLRYNSNSKIFSCYSSGQGDVQIYKKNDTRESQSISYSATTGNIDKYTLEKDIPTLNVSGVKTTVSYTSSDETVATVSEIGEITPLKAGTTTITAIAAGNAEYREAKASFLLTVTDSRPYLKVKADKESDIAAAGETIKITVDTNVDSWKATSDNADFAVGKPSGNTVYVSIAKNTGEERKANITITAGELSETITLTQNAAGGAVELKTWTYALTAKTDPKLDADNPATVNGATWSITMGTKVGKPSTNGAPTPYSQVYGWKWGDSKSAYWSSYTLSTDYFSTKQVKSVTVNFLNNGSKEATMVVKQGEITIGTVSQTFGTKWIDLTANSTQGNGGILTIKYSVEQASYIHSITVEYYE